MRANGNSAPGVKEERERERKRWSGGKGSKGKMQKTGIHPFVEDTEQRAHRDALIHEGGSSPGRGQAHSHQLQQVGVPQLAAEAKRTGWNDGCFPFFWAP